jgi:hypothetical protein
MWIPSAELCDSCLDLGLSSICDPLILQLRPTASNKDLSFQDL